MIPILSAKISASSKWCVVKIIVLFSYLILSRILHIALLEKASIPEVGSSKNMIFAPPTNDIAKLNFLLDPPLSYETKLFRSSNKSVLMRVSWISFKSSSPLIPLMNLKCSSTVSPS
jgi:hypothetical protein